MKKLYSITILFLINLIFFTTPTFANTTISLSNPNEKITQNIPFEITVNITSTDNTLGTDLVLQYNPDVLKLNSVTPGSVYPNFSNLENLLTNGTLHISGASDFSKGTIPNGLFATISFTSLKSKSTQISVAYDPTDSSLTGVIPFEGNETNLLNQTPQSLEISINKQNFFSKIKYFFIQLFSRFFNK